MGNPCTEYRVHKSKLYSYSEDISDNAKIKFQQMKKSFTSTKHKKFKSLLLFGKYVTNPN